MKKNKRHREEQSFTALNETSINDLRYDTQTCNRCPFCSIDSRMSLLEDQVVELLHLVSRTETQKELPNILRREMRGVERLVQILDSKTPIPLRKYPPQLVDSLIFQSQKLTMLLLTYVLPILENTDNNKKRFS